MKKLLLISLMSISSLSFAAEWKVVAESTSCNEKIQVMGKEGEKYVIAVKGDEKIKLQSKDGSAFHVNPMSPTEFVAKADDVTYTFFQPSYVDNNLPKIDVVYQGSRTRCPLQAK